MLSFIFMKKSPGTKRITGKNGREKVSDDGMFEIASDPQKHEGNQSIPVSKDHYYHKMI